VTDQIRVRYAPSPTGFPHVGNIRTALFNWLFARHNGGKFIIRIEDTDRARYTKGATEAILDSLRWLGLDWDEVPEAGGEFGPYFQSQRLPKYRVAADELVSKGHAYYCYCTTDRLTEMRAEQASNRQSPGYDRRCRDLTQDEIAEKEASNTPRVIRFKFPIEEKTRFKDLIRGGVEFENARIDDFIILKSDGYPTYHLDKPYLKRRGVDFQHSQTHKTLPGAWLPTAGVRPPADDFRQRPLQVEQAPRHSLHHRVP